MSHHLWSPERPDSLQQSIKWTLILLLMISLLYDILFGLAAAATLNNGHHNLHWPDENDPLFQQVPAGLKLSAAISLVIVDLVGIFVLVVGKRSTNGISSSHHQSHIILLEGAFLAVKMLTVAISAIFLLEMPQLYGYVTISTLVFLLMFFYVSCIKTLDKKN